MERQICRLGWCVTPRCGPRADVTFPAADERPTAQRADCLWLLDFSPDQVHSAPLRGPLIGRRSTASGQADCPPFVRCDLHLVKRGYGPEGVPAAADGSDGAGFRIGIGGVLQVKCGNSLGSALRGVLS